MKVFHRALQYNDPKKIHLALLGMYERTEQHNLADELVNKMTKKFKHSCKVFCDFQNKILLLCRPPLNMGLMLFQNLGLVETHTTTVEGKSGWDSSCC